MSSHSQAQHIAEWLYLLTDGRYTVLQLSKCTKQQLLSLLYIATETLPTDKPPTSLVL